MSNHQPKLSNWLRRSIRWLTFLSLLALAATAWFWPNQPLWQLGGETLLGLDDTQRIVFTSVGNHDGLQLRERSMETGELLRSRLLIDSSNRPKPSESATILRNKDWSPVLSQNGKTIVSSDEGILKVFDTKTGGQISQLEQDNTFIGSNSLDALSVANQGHLVAACAGSKLRLWDAKTGRRLKTIELPEGELGGGNPYVRIQFSFDDRYMALTNKSLLLVYEVNSMTELARLLHSVLPPVKWLPNGSLMLDDWPTGVLTARDSERYRALRVENQEVIEVDSVPANFKGEILSTNQYGVLKGHWIPKPMLPDWFPEKWKTWWQDWQSKNPGTLRLSWKQQGTDNSSVETTIKLPNDQFNLPVVSATTDNGHTVIVHNPHSTYSAWSLTGWSWYRWILFLLPLLFILVIFRPRKVIPSGSRPSS